MCENPPGTRPFYKFTIKEPQSDDYRAAVTMGLDAERRTYWDTGRVVKLNTVTLMRSIFDWRVQSPGSIQFHSTYVLLRETTTLTDWKDPPNERKYVRPEWLSELKSKMVDNFDIYRCDLLIPLVTGQPPNLY